MDPTFENEYWRTDHKGNSQLGWDRAKLAVRDAGHGVECAIPGDLDRDGRQASLSHTAAAA